MKDVKVDLKELEKDIEKNKQERLKFIDSYVEWIKKTPNKVWSKQHANFINSMVGKEERKSRTV